MGPVDRGVEDGYDLDPYVGGDAVPADGSDEQAGRGLLASPVVRGGSLALGGLGIGLLVGALVLTGGDGGADGTTGAVVAAAPTAVATDTSADTAPGSPGGTSGSVPDAALVGTLPEPTRLVIPALGIDQGFIDLTVDPDGTMGVPATASEIGWWADGPAPGESGGSLIAAHVNLDGRSGAFAELGSMEVGQEVIVDREDGTTATYQVSAVEQFAKDAFPDSRVYTYEGPTRLHLVTCGGVFDRATGHYDDNIVVFADLVSDTRAPADA